MIASIRGVIAQLALAVVLAVLVLVLRPRAPSAVDRSLAPGVAVEALAQLEIRHPGAPSITLARGQGGWTLAGSIRANDATVDALLTALRAATWQRASDAAAAGPTTDQLVAGSVTLARGTPLTGADQTWLVRGDRALLVDGWVARALFPSALDLRIRQPLASAASAQSIASGPVHLVGTQLVAPQTLWLAPDAVRDITAGLAELTIVSLERGTPMSPTTSVTVDGTTVSDAGTCKGPGVWITAPTGDGCVDAAAWSRAFGPLGALAEHAVEVVDRRPLPFTAAQLTLADGSVLELGARPHLGSDDVDLERVNDLLAALETPGTPAPLPAASARPVPTLRARDAAGREVTLALPDGLVVRGSEPVALRVTPQAWAVLTRPASALRDSVRWREEVTTLSAVTLDGVTYRRGAVLGEWTREPAGRVDTGLVDALATALATVRAPDGPTPGTIVHTLSVTFTPPAGAPSTHSLAIGALAQQRCPAKVDGALVALPLELCTAVYALASSR